MRDDGYPCYLLIKHVLPELGSPVETEKVFFLLSLLPLAHSCTHTHAHSCTNTRTRTRARTHALQSFIPQTANSFFLLPCTIYPFINCFCFTQRSHCSTNREKDEGKKLANFFPLKATCTAGKSSIHEGA